MKPLYLEMENIGPFTEKTAIDFSKFDDQTLFLISGPTGAGKSFIFDAMSYALFGDTPSKRSKNLKSDYAAVGEVPRIIFRFDIGSQIYQVVRELEYEDNKGRGDGTTNRAEKAELLHLVNNTTKNVLATKKTEVGKKCEEILGLKMDQFSRVMLIPQGEFRELLISKSEDKEKLLRHLFRSMIYIDIQHEISRVRKGKEEKINEFSIANETLLESVKKDIPEEVNDNVEEGVVFEDIGSSIDFFLKDIPAITADVKAAKEQFDIDNVEFQKIIQLLEMQKENEKLEKSLQELNRKEKEIFEPLREKLKQHNTASKLRPEISLIEQLEIKRKEIEKNLIKSEELLKQYKNEAKEADNAYNKKIPLLRKKEKQLTKDIQRLSDLAVLCVQIDLDRKELDIQQAIEKKKKEVLDNTISSYEKKKLSLMIFEDESKPLKKEVIDVSLLEQKLERIQNLLELIQKQSEITKELDEEIAKLQSMLTERKTFEQELNELKKKWLSSFAGRLAQNLIEGEPCPVCGSNDHIERAQIPEDTISDEELNQKEEQFKEFIEAVSSQEKIIITLKERMNNKKENLDKIFNKEKEWKKKSPEDLSSLKKDIEKEVHNQKEKNQRLIELEKEIETLREEIKEMEQMLVDLYSVYNEINARFTSQTSLLNSHSAPFV